MPGRSFGAESRYGFNGKERDKDMNGLTAYDYGFRIYNPAIGKFLSVDPLSKSYPWNCPYSYAEGDVIRSIDLDGLERYIVTGRAFAPWFMFGGPYLGDFRGFSVQTRFNKSDPGPSARIHSIIGVDMTMRVASFYDVLYPENSTWSDPSHGPKNFGIFDPVVPKLKTATAKSTGEIEWQGESKETLQDGTNKSWVTYESSFEGNNPLVTASPDIDYGNSVSLEFRTNDKTSSYELYIYGHIKGDKFPAYETFITDPKGNSLMLATYAPESKSKISRLIGGSVYISGFEFKVKTDKDGNFLKVIDVRDNYKEYSIVEWNSRFLNQKPAGDCVDNKCKNEE